MNTIEFMGMINYSFPEGGLTCSFNNAQMNQFYQLKKREAGVLPVKAAVNQVRLYLYIQLHNNVYGIFYKFGFIRRWAYKMTCTHGHCLHR